DDQAAGGKDLRLCGQASTFSLLVRRYAANRASRQSARFCCYEPHTCLVSAAHLVFGALDGVYGDLGLDGLGTACGEIGRRGQAVARRRVARCDETTAIRAAHLVAVVRTRSRQSAAILFDAPIVRTANATGAIRGGLADGSGQIG